MLNSIDKDEGTIRGIGGADRMLDSRGLRIDGIRTATDALNIIEVI
ncbi:MAG: hypothetical protein WAM14_12010 [Candidatus Nitrosopolaris sp.]